MCQDDNNTAATGPALNMEASGTDAQKAEGKGQNEGEGPDEEKWAFQGTDQAAQGSLKTNAPFRA